MAPKKAAVLRPPALLWVDTPAGEITYTLTRKRVRNLNLRVRGDGSVALSTPLHTSQKDIDAFIRSKYQWISDTRQKMLAQPPPQPCRYTREECLEHFTRLSDSIFPLFAGLLGGHKPQLKVREMKTRWGVCHVTKRTITLNTRLAEKPIEAQEYVMLHEYVHFLHPHHQAPFHAEMLRLMPDYRMRAKLLK